MHAPPQLTLFLVAMTYAGVAVGGWPGLRMNRATLALVGAAAVVATGGLAMDRALAALDLHTLLLLFSMMVLNANLRLAGFFGLVAAATLRAARSPRGLLAMLLVTSGVLSALFLNDTICLMLTPLVVEVTRRLKRDPLPYLIGLATSANIGSVATITGNPQNMLVGMSAGLGYLEFLADLGPVAALGLVLNYGVLVALFRDEFTRQPLEPVPPPAGAHLSPPALQERGCHGPAAGALRGRDAGGPGRLPGHLDPAGHPAPEA